MSELYRPSNRRLLAKLVPTFADRGCQVVGAAYFLRPYSRLSRLAALVISNPNAGARDSPENLDTNPLLTRLISQEDFSVRVYCHNGSYKWNISLEAGKTKIEIMCSQKNFRLSLNKFLFLISASCCVYYQGYQKCRPSQRFKKLLRGTALLITWNKCINTFFFVCH
jgi:hypothetical protein